MTDKKYTIKLLEKGPLQRFRNQNILKKKFGMVGINLYRAIKDGITVEELKNLISIEDKVFQTILKFMEESKMIKLEPAPAEKEEKIEERLPEEAGLTEETREEKTLEEKRPPEEEIKFEEEKEIKEGVEFEGEKEETMPKTEEGEEIKPIEEEITPEEEIKPEGEEISFEAEGKKEGEIKEEIKPIQTEVEEAKEEEIPEEIKPEKEEEIEVPEEKIPKEEEEIISEEEILRPEEEISPEELLSPSERMIKEKFGDVGLKVYELIDGQKTAEEIMKETGLDEKKLVEILDFMDEKGIIKLEYPKGEKKGPPPMKKEEESSGFKPMIEERVTPGKVILSKEIGAAPLDVPNKLPISVVKKIKVKTKLMLKYGGKGMSVYKEIDGKKDTVEIAKKLNLPLYFVDEVINFLSMEEAVNTKALPRPEVRKKYGDDAYAVYKKFGKEGIMLYELIGKDMSLKEMAEMVSKNKEKVVDIFIFIHQVLGIELPIDREILLRQVGAK